MIRVHHYEERDGWHVCKYCGKIKPRSGVGESTATGPRWCPGKPPVRADASAELEAVKAERDRWQRAAESQNRQWSKECIRRSDTEYALQVAQEELSALRAQVARCEDRAVRWNNHSAMLRRESRFCPADEQDRLNTIARAVDECASELRESLRFTPAPLPACPDCSGQRQQPSEARQQLQAASKRVAAWPADKRAMHETAAQCEAYAAQLSEAERCGTCGGCGEEKVGASCGNIITCRECHGSGRAIERKGRGG